MDKSDHEYESYVEILRYNDNLKNLKNNPKSTSFITNGNEYRYINNKLYTLVDVTREIANRHPNIYNMCLSNKNSSFYISQEENTDMNNIKGEYLNKGKNDDHKKNKDNDEGINNNTTCNKWYDSIYFRNGIRKNEINEKNVNTTHNREKDTLNYDYNNYYNTSTLFLDNDYSVEKRIYNELHKKYQWVSILEDERMNPGFKNYNHNCFNINTCNKIFTHLIVCLLPDGGINKLRVYGEIKNNEKARKKNYKKTINVCNILDGANIVYTTDEFYGKSENILIDHNSEYVMGWQTRRSINRPLRYVENLSLNNISSIFLNNNYCIIKLSYITNIKYIEINTIFYEYNSPLCVSIDSCNLKEIHPQEKTKQIQFFNDHIQNIQWVQLLPLSYIKGNHINFFSINKILNKTSMNDNLISTHLRLNIYPDGGINTIKVYGTVLED